MVNEDLAKRINATMYPLEPEQKGVVCTAEGESMNLIGKIYAALTLGGNPYTHHFYVRRPPPDITPNFNVLVGIDLIEKIGELTIKMRENCVILYDRFAKIRYVFRLEPDSTEVIVRSFTGQKWKYGQGVPMQSAPYNIAHNKQIADVTTDDENLPLARVAEKINRSRSTAAYSSGYGRSQVNQLTTQELASENSALQPEVEGLDAEVAARPAEMSLGYSFPTASYSESKACSSEARVPSKNEPGYLNAQRLMLNELT
jgi:hypothetical protein